MSGTRIAFYRKEDWNRFLDTIDDRKTVHDTWEEWFQAFIELKFKLISEGFVVEDFIINIDGLVAYCKKNNLPNTGKTRSQYVSK